MSEVQQWLWCGLLGSCSGIGSTDAVGAVGIGIGSRSGSSSCSSSGFDFRFDFESQPQLHWSRVDELSEASKAHGLQRGPRAYHQLIEQVPFRVGQWLATEQV